jgi:hypothetical protein
MTETYDENALRQLLQERSRGRAEHQAKLASVFNRMLAFPRRPNTHLDAPVIEALLAECDRVRAHAEEHDKETARLVQLLQEKIDARALTKGGGES